MAISVVMSDQEHPALWDPLFTLPPRGQWARGKFEGSGVPVPARSLIEELLSEQPTALILDELQTWYESLSGPGGGTPRDRAFNFLQTLSEIASSRPDLLRLIVAVRNNDTQAYQQIHRNTPALVDFQGANARIDRLRLTQHRLFENHRMIPRAEIESASREYADERARLLFPAATGPARDDVRRAVFDAWPFAPELLDVVEDGILMSATAQETRDLMRILARMYRARGEAVPILTVADIDVMEDARSLSASIELASMVDAMAGVGNRLREVAQQNLRSLREQGLDLEHQDEIVSGLWVRSLAPGPLAGATERQLHLDVTRDRAIDDNAFDVELEKLKAASFNVHPVGERLVFKLEENARSKLLASARNDRLFAAGQDLSQIQQAIAAALSPMDGATSVVSRLIVMGPDWETQPWLGRTSDELPQSWREPVIIVLPESPSDEALGRWLAEHVPERRNLVRFLLPGQLRTSPYADREVRELARCVVLATDWSRTDPQYLPLQREYQGRLRGQLATWFDRLAVLRSWNYANPAQIRFDRDTLPLDGKKGVLGQVEDHIATALFDVDAFRDYVRNAATSQRTALDIIWTLAEPPTSPDESAIPFIGESALYERILRMVAAGELSLYKQGTWFRRDATDTDMEAAHRRIRTSAWVTGRYLGDVEVALPGAAPAPPSVAAPQAGGGTVTVATAVRSTGTGQTAAPALGETRSGYVAEAIEDVRTEDVSWKITTLASSGARKPVNLLGEVRSWNLSDQPLSSVRFEASDVTPAQLNDILKRLPPTIELKLEVEYQEEAE
jgi:hypothetical protein